MLACASAGGGPAADRPGAEQGEGAALAAGLRVRAPSDVALSKGCSPAGPERCFNAIDDNCNGIVDEGCGVNTGLLQFVAAWDKPSADVDLDVTDPNGELAEVERASESGLVKENDCPGQNNECHGQNLENVFLEGNNVTRGAYRVRIRLEQLGSEDPPVEVTLGARVGPKTYRAEILLAAQGDERVLLFEL
jgi:tRNA (guanosine-2'-O-)-methyltransferase